MRKFLAGLALATIAAGSTMDDSIASATGGGPPPPTTNDLDYWCPAGGIKLEPVSTPFVVPRRRPDLVDVARPQGGSGGRRSARSRSGGRTVVHTDGR